MANDYMAKLAADLEGMSMMRSPKPMTVVYRDAGGDLGGFDYDLLEAADIAEYESFDGTGGANTQGNMTGVDAEAYKQAAIADPDLPTGDEFDPSTPASEGGYPQIVADNLRREKLEFEDLQFIIEAAKNAPPGTKFYMPNIPLYNQKNRVAQDVITKQDRKSAPDVPYPTDIDNKIDYDALFDRYATPEEKNRETQPPTGEELMDRHNEFFDQELMGLKNNMTRGFSDDPDMRLLADGSLFDGKAKGGKVDSIQALADSLESYGRKGDTMLAHINPKEAQMLMDKGGAGTINPMTGLPEFYFDDPGYSTDADMSGAEGDISDTSGIGKYDDSDAGQAGPMPDTPALSPPTSEELEDFYGLASGALDPVTGVGTGGPGEFSGGPDDRSFTAPALRDAIRKRLNRPGGMTDAESHLYTQILQQFGFVSDEAIDYMANLLSTPGIKSAVESGYSEGYQYGGILGDALAARDNALGAMSAQIKKAEKKVREGYKEQEDRDALGAIEEVETNYFGDIIGDIVGGVKDYFMGPSKEDELAYAQAARDAGFTFSPISDEAKYFDKGLGYVAPGPIGFAKGLYDVGAFLTDSRIIGDVDTPYGTFALTESGDLTAPDMFVGADDFGNEPTITKKRKAATQPVKKEEEKKEEEKDYFPKQKLPSLTQSGLEALQYAYRNDPPEVLDNILNKYALPDQTSGLRALV